MNIIDRIKMIMEKESIKSDKEFAEIIDIEQKTVWNYLNNRRKPSLEFISKIIAIYPHINLYWLLTGNGSMEVSNTSTNDNNGSLVTYLKEEIESLKIENNRLRDQNAYYRVLLDNNDINYKQTAI